MALAAGSNVGPYRIIESVGRGGMASVFKAYEPALDRYIALKVLPPEFLHDPTFAERFRREAQTIAKLEHPQIIPIYAYDIDEATGTPWMAMRLISGGSLSQRIKRSRIAPSEASRILKEVADALDYAHNSGVIHRDVKPQNVLLDDSGRVYLADFGIAKMIESSAHMTQTGMITGTPQYMAPEQALGRSIDKSVDIYALGIVAYELYTGRVPFAADTPVAVLMKQANEPMPLPPTSEVPEDVTRAILRATAKDPVSRWPTASAFAGALSAANTSVGSIGATSVMAPISGLDMGSAPTQATAALTAQAPTVPTAPPVSAATGTRRSGAGIGVVLGILLFLGLAGSAAMYAAYRYFNASKSETPALTTQTTTQLPIPATTPSVAAATPVAEGSPEATLAPTQASTPATAVPQPTRRVANAVRPSEDRSSSQPGQIQPPLAPVNPPPAAAPARTTIHLEVEASQPSTGSQISVLYAQIQIDGRPYRDFAIRFVGANSFARWKRVEKIVIDDVPLKAREITLVVATDSSLDGERMEGSARLALQSDDNNLEAAVRFYNQFDKSVKFR